MRELLSALILFFLTLLMPISIYANENSEAIDLFKNQTAGLSSELMKQVEMPINNVKLKSLSMPFIINKGQFNDDVAFVGKTFGGDVFITKKGELFYNLVKVETEIEGKNKIMRQVGGVVITEKFLGKRDTEIKGLLRHEGKVNYFKGSDSSKWVRDVEIYKEISLGEIYDGIELRLKAYGNNVEKLFYVSSKGKVESIRITLDGIERLGIDEKGELLLVTEFGNVAFTKPVAYQLEDGKAVDVAYRKLGEREYGFFIGDYDKDKTLVIDPLIASTYLGGNENDFIFAIAVDKAGNIYVGGQTLSSDFPTTAGAKDRIFNGISDAFVAKFDSDLRNLLASTFIGGNLGEYITSIKLDNIGNLYVVGGTESTDFPTTVGARDRTHNGGIDGFIAKLNGELSDLLASTYHGGNSNDAISAIELDSSGNVYVVGYTTSDNFPVTPGSYDISKNPEIDGFVSKLKGDLSNLLASTFLGGSKYDNIYAIDLDSSGNVFVAGRTESTDFPTTPGARDRTHNGGNDAFIAKFNSDLSSLLASTFHGGNSFEEINAMKIDSSGNVYVVGSTESANFPTLASSYDTTLGGLADAFISKFNSNLSKLLATTFLGGSGNEVAFAISIDSVGNIYVAGYTNSSDFPTSSSARDRTHNGAQDGFISKLDGKLSKLLASTYFGGKSNDSIFSLTIDNAGNIIVAGDTFSNNFPTVSDNYDVTYNGFFDGFVSKFTPALSSCVAIFSDVPCSHWAYDHIRWVKEKGITTLTGTYFPDDTVTRAQMAAFIIRALEGEPVVDTYSMSPYFSDVPTTHWAFKYIQRVKERGIASGYAGTTLYGPDDPVTREQMAKMLIMAFVSEGRISEPASDYCATGSPFDDVAQDSWSCRFVKRLREAGVTKGCNPPTNTLYCPTENVTRAQMAVFLYRAFDR